MTDKEKVQSAKAQSTGAESKKSANATTKVDAEANATKSTEAGSSEVKSAKSKPAAKTAAKKTAVKNAGEKKIVEKKTEAEIKTANDAIRSKKSIEELKARAHEAKLRAQKKILEKSFVSDPPVDPLVRLADTFHQSARRWEMVVYPSLFAFVLLAGYGFFLIYRLTHDISILSHSVTRMAVIVSEAMPRMTKDMGIMTGSMDNMTGNISGMSGDIKSMTTEVSSMSGQMNTLTPLSKNISNMTGTMNELNRSVYGMQRDMGGMNRTISSGPFGMMNDMMPLHSNTNVTPPLPPPTYRQPWEIRRPYAGKRNPVVKAKTATAAKSAVNKKSKKNVSIKDKNLKPVQHQPIKQKNDLQKPAMNGSGLTYHQIIAARRNQ